MNKHNPKIGLFAKLKLRWFLLLRSILHLWVKATRNFKNSANKRAYLYLLTPKGIEAKARLSVCLLQRKMEEYDALRAEIEQLRNEPKHDGTNTRL